MAKLNTETTNEIVNNEPVNEPVNESQIPIESEP